jgi:3-dehydroquinate synthase
MKVLLRDNSYDIIFASLSEIRNYIDIPAKTKILILSSPKIAKLYYPKLIASFKKDCHTFLYNLPPGEKTKTLTSVEKVYTFLIQNNFSRNDLIIALGGGVIGDLAGFIAATYLRGINYLQAPTTLLAQVDSAVAGKTGVNHPLGKNLIGACYQPRLVLIDKTTLSTLPQTELRSGLAEVIKYALIKDHRFFKQLEDDLTISNKMIAKCCLLKARIVQKDEKENNLRIILNFGHTIAHMLEAYTGYKRFFHGEAVALGMLAAAYISMKRNQLSAQDYQRIKKLITRANLPVKIDFKINFQRAKKIMLHDKKVKTNKLHFVLLRRIGDTSIANDIPWELVQDSLQNLK